MPLPIFLRDSTDVAQGAYVQSSDPGAVVVKRLWIDITSSPYPVKKRNASSGWDLLGYLMPLATGALHASSHEDGGADELDVTDLSGLLADPQTPLSHTASHANGGADELSVAGLSGLLADAQTPLTHHASHENGGADEIDVTGLSGVLADPQTPITENVQDIVGAMATDSADLDYSYDDGAGTFTAVLKATATAFSPAFVVLTDGATVTIATAGKRINNSVVTLGGNRTLAITGAVDGVRGTLIVKQSGGGNTLALPAGSKVSGGGGGVATLSAGAGAIDVLTWFYDGTNYFWDVKLNYT